MEFIIRTGGELDLDEILVLERAVAEAPHWSREEYAALGGSESDGAVSRCVLVAEGVGDEGVMRLVGFAVGKFVGMDGQSAGELESVVVAEAARRTGVGRALCQGVLEWCRQRGAAAVELEVRSRNIPARRLYSSVGFQEEGLRRGYYRDPADDAVLMRLAIAGHSAGNEDERE